MKIPSFYRASRLLPGIGLFLSGVIIGSSIFMGVYHQNFNFLVVELRKLKSDNERLSLDLESLTKFKDKQTVIQRVTVHLKDSQTPPLNEDIRKELEKKVQNDMKVVVGQKVNSVNDSLELYEKLISDRTYYGVFEKDYVVRVKAIMLVKNELVFWIAALERNPALPEPLQIQRKIKGKANGFLQKR
ncbi:hypothetical protein P7H20_03355 [Paenibacillus larvae]|nr:hypothetical protein [Paenibacillus larvae]MDT2274111.1 hypothetical protein [Paenibacillus larvae]